MALHDELYLPIAGPRTGSSSVKAGFAEADITPTPGMETPGGYVKAFSHSIHDPCKVRAAVFDDGKSRVALVSVDAVLIPNALAQATRCEIEACTGIPTKNITIAATHSHSSGPIGMVQPGEFDHASPLVQKLAYEESSCANPAYLKRVQEQLVAAVTQANDKRVEAWLSFGNGREDNIAFNRRFKMKNGQTCTHPGRNHPDIVEPAGPIDPEVGVLGAWDREGKLLGCIVNYACHGTTSPEGFSANWIYYLEKTIRGGIDSDPFVLFLQGCSGDVTQVDNLSPYTELPPEQSAQRVGGCVGAEALKVLFCSEPGNDITLGAASTTLKIPRRVRN